MGCEGRPGCVITAGNPSQCITCNYNVTPVMCRTGTMYMCLRILCTQTKRCNEECKNSRCAYAHPDNETTTLLFLEVATYILPNVLIFLQYVLFLENLQLPASNRPHKDMHADKVSACIHLFVEHVYSSTIIETFLKHHDTQYIWAMPF